MKAACFSRLPHLATPRCLSHGPSQVRQSQLRTAPSLGRFKSSVAAASPRLQRPCLSTGISRELYSRRQLVTLAIETSCDDACVAVLEKLPNGAAHLHFNEKETADNRSQAGINPAISVQSHSRKLGALIKRALHALPRAGGGEEEDGSHSVPPEKAIWIARGEEPRRKPDFISVTRGPGMVGALSTGLNMAKGLSAAWDVPLLGVNHMQAHALTPHLVNALEKGRRHDGNAPATTMCEKQPAFPFLSLLVSGGHSLLVRSQGLHDHAILAEPDSTALGNMLDMCAREILPQSVISSAENVMYGRLLEQFAFDDQEDGGKYSWYEAPRRRRDEITVYESGFGWSLSPSMSTSSAMKYDFAGTVGQVVLLMTRRKKELRERGAQETEDGIMPLPERRLLARQVMRLGFEHLASRLVFALRDIRELRERALSRKTRKPREYNKHFASSSTAKSPLAAAAAAAAGKEGTTTTIPEEPKTVVVSGGVASNRFLMHVLRSVLQVRGFGDVEIVAPPPALCVDNAAMIAWLGMEMYEENPRRHSDLSVLAVAKWPLDPNGPTGGVLGIDGWVIKDEEK